jgi:hypothetical protein
MSSSRLRRLCGRNDVLVGSDDLRGGVYAQVDGRVHAASQVCGQSYVTLIDDGDRLIDRAATDRVFRRVVSGRWRGEPVTVWVARTPGAVRVQLVNADPSRARALGMRGDRTMWELVPCQATFARFTSSRRARSCALRLRQMM